jgi:alginate O-acetyltransferase complex protein AlgI
MSEISVTLASASPRETPAAPDRQLTVPTSRLLLAWAVLLGGLFGFWFCRPWMRPIEWVNLTLGVLWATSKFATLVCMPPDQRRRLGWCRFTAYLFWPGMQPSHFLPERTPAGSRPAPSVPGMLLNAVAACVFLWALPGLMPSDWPQSVRVVSGQIGYAFLFLFAFLDAWALLYRACGIGVEKLWHCPIASTSLADFWGRRWNRIFSGMLREVLFFPLARRLGAGLALFAVFLYSGLLHENFSVAARSGYGLPLVYFAIQGLAMWSESRRAFRSLLQRRPWLGRLWTAAVVLGPVPLLFPAGFCEQVMVPTLADLGVPGLAPR